MLTNQNRNTTPSQNQTRNRPVAASGGAVFYGWMFLFTVAIAGSGGFINQSKD